MNFSDFKEGFIFGYWDEDNRSPFKTEVIAVKGDQVWLKDIDPKSPDKGLKWTDSISEILNNEKHIKQKRQLR